MLILVPLLAYVFALLRLRLTTHDWRVAALGAAIFWGVYLTILTEGLSAFRLVTPNSVALGWALASVVAIAVWMTGRRHRQTTTAAEPRAVKPLDRIAASLVLGVVLLVGAVGVTALVAPPNTWDSMEYHLPRIVEWMTYQSVQFFPTNDFRNLIFSPWAEYAMLNMYLLNGDDRFVNLVEWFSFAGAITGVSLIARQLGASTWGQVLAAVFCATLPGFILEASGSMNTGVMAFWLVTTVYFLNASVQSPSLITVIAAAAAAGLAILTKGPAYFFLPPIGLACWWLGSARSRKMLLLASPAIAAIILGLNAPQYVRNIQLTGHPQGLPFPEATQSLGSEKLENDRVTFSGTISTVLRNAALEVATPSARVNDVTIAVVSGFIRAIGADPVDPANTWPDTAWWKGFQLPNDLQHEIVASNPVQFVLLSVIGVALAFDRRKRVPAGVTFMLGLVGAFVLYCALLRWTVWDSRYFIGLLALGAALLGTVIERMPRPAGAALGSFLLLVGLGFAAENEIRPLGPLPNPSSNPSIFQVPRAEMYFADQHQEIASSWMAAANTIKAGSCMDVAIDAPDGHYWVYPMMALLNDDGTLRRIRFSGVTNSTSVYGDGSISNTCAIVCLYCATIPAKTSDYARNGWETVVVGDTSVFLAKDSQVATSVGPLH